ncbi:MAG: SusE domain-containing protein [Saprospiraceae bacterium]|nr:SusE domain-containing protein [Saprospiraceae bacterium]
MKSLNKILFLGLAFVLALGGCKKEETQVVLNPNAKLTGSLSASTLALLKDNETKDALTVNWVKPDFGFPAAATYEVHIDKRGGTFASPVVISGGTSLAKVFKTSELNNLLINMGTTAGSVADVDVKVKCLFGASNVLETPVMNLKVTTYADKLDLSTIWGVVGSATPGGWNGPDMPMYKTAVTNELVAYVTLIAGDIKFRTNNDWTTNLGGSNGTLSAGGANIAVTAGTYKITMNPVALTYKIEPFTWGIVGSATTNGWNGPDMPMWYDATVDLWRAEVKLVAGDIKFRQNNAWTTEFGGSAGALVAGGANIAVTAGTYLITADFKNLKYTITPYKPIGIVGDATPNGWGGPDIKFTYDLSTKTWYLNNVTLTAAQIKFRENDAWDNNWGSTNSTEPDPIAASGGLKTGGKNFGVTAGVWSFTLDLTDANNPKYTAKKK